MHHRNHVKTQADTTQRQGLPFLHHLDTIGNTIVTFNHRGRLGVRDDLTFWIIVKNHFLKSAMVRLHVIHNKIVDLLVPDLILYV